MIKEKAFFRRLYAIQKYPLMYLHRKSIFYLESFIVSFWEGVHYAGIGKFVEEDMIQNFLQFTREKYQANAAENAYTCFCHECGDDEEKAFDLFFEELTKFLKGIRMDLS